MKSGLVISRISCPSGSGWQINSGETSINICPAFGTYTAVPSSSTPAFNTGADYPIPSAHTELSGPSLGTTIARRVPETKVDETFWSKLGNWINEGKGMPWHNEVSKWYKDIDSSMGTSKNPQYFNWIGQELNKLNKRFGDFGTFIQNKLAM